MRGRIRHGSVVVRDPHAAGVGRGKLDGFSSFCAWISRQVLSCPVASRRIIRLKDLHRYQQ